MSNEQATLLADTLRRLFRDHGKTQAALSEAWNDPLWRQLDEMALPGLLVEEAQGGVGATFEDALPVALALGAHAVALPLGEAMLARRAASRCGLALDDAVSRVGLASTVAGVLEPGAGGPPRFTGSLHGVPWGRHLQLVLAVLENAAGLQLLALPVDAAQCRPAHNPAGEPRDRLVFDKVAPVSTAACTIELAQGLHYLGALWRVGQMAGAMLAMLERTVGHARDRVQFGKPIGSFQAVQQQLALFGTEAAAVVCAAQAAFRSATRGTAHFEIAAAKLRANLAVETATAVAHQVHGAIGFTREHDLRHFTQRLLAWRSEFGSDRHWSEALGQAVIARGVDTFWSDLTARGDAAALETT